MERIVFLISHDPMIGVQLVAAFITSLHILALLFPSLFSPLSPLSLFRRVVLRQEVVRGGHSARLLQVERVPGGFLYSDGLYRRFVGEGASVGGFLPHPKQSLESQGAA